MSHITTIALRVFAQYEAELERAANTCGLEKRDKRTHKAYGGGTNKCRYALGLKGDLDSYEIGVVKSADADGDLELRFDDYGQGKLLAAVGGRDWPRLRREYAAEVATTKANAELARDGFEVYRENLPDGRIRLEARRR